MPWCAVAVEQLCEVGGLNACLLCCQWVGGTFHFGDEPGVVCERLAPHTPNPSDEVLSARCCAWLMQLGDIT